MTGVNPFAYYDTLAICIRLQPSLERTAVSEVHLFAYLACLLSLYRGIPVSDWGYQFVATENGSPFSAQIESAIPFIVAAGFANESDRFLTITPLGQRGYDDLAELDQNKRREQFIAGACSSVLALPLGVIRSVVTTDHDMKLANTFGATRQLLTESAVERMHDTFAVLSEAIGIHINDLMVPAVVWLNYLAQVDSLLTPANSKA